MALHQVNKLLAHLKTIQLPTIQQEVFKSLTILDARGEDGNGAVKYQFRVSSDLVNLQGFMKDETLHTIGDALTSLSATALDSLGRNSISVQTKLSKFGRNRVGTDLTLTTSVRALGRDMTECEAILGLGGNILAHMKSTAYME
mmetsp:Transcript_958/g.2325  ORF Transcript_958/g.2325 Transcript_958/m.2325 type:complete len:144 (-) Transcript_958:2110-2541(-)